MYRGGGISFDRTSGASSGIGRGRIVYDGRRMRKAMTRRTIDPTSTIVRAKEATRDTITGRRLVVVQPTPHHLINMLPSQMSLNDPIDGACTKFVHMSMNKARCPINVARWFPDGKRVVTGASTGELTLWNGSTFNFETILQAHDSAIRTMTWNHAGSFMISGDHLGVIKIFQPSMNNIKTIEGAHAESIRALTFAPMDAKFASASDDGAVKVWDFRQAKEECTLAGHGWDVRCVDWHPQLSLLASGSKDSLIKLWDPRVGGEPVETLYGHKNSILDVRWNAINGQWLASSAKDQLIKLFDLRMMKEFATYRGHTKEINTIQWHRHHETLFSTASGDGSIMYWLVGQEEKEVGLLQGAHEGIVWSLDWHPMGHIMMSASADCTIRFWTRSRPGDSLKDRYTLGVAAAEAMGISTATQHHQHDEEEEEQQQQQQPGRPNRYDRDTSRSEPSSHYQQSQQEARYDSRYDSPRQRDGRISHGQDRYERRDSYREREQHNRGGGGDQRHGASGGEQHRRGPPPPPPRRQ